MRRASLFGAIMCVIAVHPSCGLAENDYDWHELRPSAAAAASPSAAATSGAQDSDSPVLGSTIATGTISGLHGGGNPEMELRLRPQPNGFLRGELVIHQSGFGMTPLDGYLRGNHLQFQVPYGSETYYFQGERRGDQMSGTFESTPSGERGAWLAQVGSNAEGRPSSVEIPSQ